jgi:heme/copper-type cytochrome/quinol oxidase subunit 4
MKRQDILPLGRRLLRRDWEVLLLIAIGSLLLLSLQLIGDTSDRHSPYPLVRNLIEILDLFRTTVLPVLQPLSFVAIACYLVLPLPLRWRRGLVDLFAVWFMARIAVLFALINLLIFLRMNDHAQMIAQLLLFLPCLLLMWGWIYWRMDTRCQIRSGRRMFDFKLADDASPTIYDYFLVSFTSLISNTLRGFTGLTRTARTLIFIHGVMMWDIMGLMLSRAIALVTT